MKTTEIGLIFGFLALLMSCKVNSTSPQDNSTIIQGEADAKSKELIEVLESAMGGQKAYQALRTLRWNFFGRRDLIWDKHNGDVRIDVPADQATYLLNLDSQEGSVRVGDALITHPDSLAQKLEQARRMWINDSYWLVMPFKLRDPGVTVAYVGPDTTQTGEKSEVLSLTFNAVGVTPQNKYHVWVSDQSKLIKQWAFYVSATDQEPRAIWPWDNYQKVLEGNELQFSFDRSDDKGPKKVRAYGKLPDEVFKSLELPAENLFKN